MPVAGRPSLLWTVVFMTLPCPLFLVYCAAVLPPIGVVVLGINLIEQEAALGLAFAAVLLAETAVILFLLRWVVRLMASRLPPRAPTTAIVVLLLASLLPIYFLECMDGHAFTPCSLPMIVRAGLTAGRQCGDLGW